MFPNKYNEGINKPKLIEKTVIAAEIASNLAASTVFEATPRPSKIAQIAPIDLASEARSKVAITFNASPKVTKDKATAINDPPFNDAPFVNFENAAIVPKIVPITNNDFPILVHSIFAIDFIANANISIEAAKEIIPLIFTFLPSNLLEKLASMLSNNPNAATLVNNFEVSIEAICFKDRDNISIAAANFTKEPEIFLNVLTCLGSSTKLNDAIDLLNITNNASNATTAPANLLVSTDDKINKAPERIAKAVANCIKPLGFNEDCTSFI